MDNVNIEKLVEAVHTHAVRAKELKRRLRRRWTEPMEETQRALVHCRRRTTQLCILRAWLRGKHHLQAPLREGAYPGMRWEPERYHLLVAEQTAVEFLSPETAR